MRLLAGFRSFCNSSTLRRIKRSSPLDLQRETALYFLANLAAAFDYSGAGYSQEQLTSSDTLLELFESWMPKYEKSYYSMEEKMLRFKVFRDRVNNVDRWNQEEISGDRGRCWKALTMFADLTYEEFMRDYCAGGARLRRSGSVPAPGAEIPVKNFGSCGPCDQVHP